MSARPRHVVVVAGTGTEVGKTWAAVELAAALVADGWTVEARKPAQSGTPGEPGDAVLLAAATGESEDRVCPPHRRYSVPMAPPMAAAALGVEPPTIGALVAEVDGSWGVRAADVGIVELAGGVASPAAEDGDGADLAAALAADAAVLVADAGLGTINAVRLTLDRLAAAGVPRPTVLLNRFDGADDLHRRNRDWLADRDGTRVVTTVAALVEAVLAGVPRHCGFCGEPATECDRDCVRPLDPDHFCVRCGRRLVVSVSPTRHSARCKVHGDHCA